VTLGIVTGYTFGKSQRLLNAKAYKTVFDDAQLKVSTQQILFLARSNGLNHSRLGLVIAKKNARLAVQRNRIKRLVRNSFRLQQHELVGIDVVVLARRGLDKLDNNVMLTMVDRLWLQLSQRAERKLKKQTLDH
jgi:ribonuclease P protein component